MSLTDEQLAQLLKPLNPIRVAKRENLSYLEAWDVIAHLGRVFGPENWDKTIEYGLIYEDFSTWVPRGGGAEKSGWDVAYHAKCQLTIRDPAGVFVCCKEDAATGSAIHQPSRADAHDLALKSAVSDALKRAAKDLGNQFGLSLYDGGSTNSVLGTTLARKLDKEAAA